MMALVPTILAAQLTREQLHVLETSCVLYAVRNQFFAMLLQYVEWQVCFHYIRRRVGRRAECYVPIVCIWQYANAEASLVRNAILLNLYSKQALHV